VRVKYGSFYADWRDRAGVRHMKAFCTIGEALAWKALHRRHIPRLSDLERRHHARRSRRAWQRRHRHEQYERQREMRWRFQNLYGRKQAKHLTNYSVITHHALDYPTYLYIDQEGTKHVEHLESPEQMIARLRHDGLLPGRPAGPAP